MGKKLLSQFSTLLIISLFIGFVFYSFGLNFFIGIGVGVVVQFALYHAFLVLVNLYAALENKKIENERIKEFSFQSMEVTCPCFKQKKEIIPIRLNANNQYKCSECEKTISVFITPETAILTEPIVNTDLTVVNKLIQEKLANGNA
jgi:hypothetical protein